MNVAAAPPEHTDVVVIGGGQAGLSMSWFLKRDGIDHVVLERHRVGHAWREQRWDSFCLVTPNWQCALPGFPYAGDDPHGFMPKHEIVAYVEAFARSFDPPLREGVAATRLRPREDGAGFALETSRGAMTATQVVVAVGGYHTPKIPAAAARLPADIHQIPSVDYHHPGQLPAGAVLVVGSGQSGCQIAEDLHLAGRVVHLCVGGAPRTARFYRGRDVVDWLFDMGHYDLPVDQHPLRERVRDKANHYVTGRGGGRDIDLRKFAREGMRLHGRFEDVEGTRVITQPDLARNLDRADASAQSIKQMIDAFIARAGVAAPTEPPYAPVWEPEAETTSLDLRAEGITSVIWSIGYASDYRWIDIPVFTGRGYPGHTRGVTATPGLYFLGLPWLYTWGSGRFGGVARDAEHLLGHVAARRAALAAVG
jgi:putative flavoprotein involved in K+ transport